MTMKEKILAKMEESFVKAEKHYNRKFSRPVNIIWKRNGVVGGWCNFYRKEFMFQLDLAESNEKDFIHQIVPHEVAHWIDVELHGYQYSGKKRIHHGHTWQRIMMECYGLLPHRCHSYDTSVTTIKGGKLFAYKCNCRVHHVTQYIHTKIQKGQNRICCRCKGKLKYDISEQIETINNQIKKLQAQINEIHN